ncbi:hypothetical protein [Sagittula sp.]|uniref:hypothetical protein n=1 Tax=Sagittula sp. TaxID=2038081 RepID=UPI003513110A
MFAILSGTAAFVLSLIAAWHFVDLGMLLAAASSATGGLCTLALLKTLTDVADHLEDLNRKTK